MCVHKVDKKIQVAIVVDWLVGFSGAEFVLKSMLELFPDADIFTTVDFLPEKDRAFLEGHQVHTTFIQKLPKAKTQYRQYLALMPLAVEQLDLSSYSLVISSSHAVAKGVITGPLQTHISYIHSPIRYAWDLQHQYLQESGLTKGIKSWVARVILHYIRMWDLRTAHGVDHFAANSSFIAKRVWKVYRREAQVIHPPIDCDAFEPCSEKGDFYFTSSRLVPYKKINLIIEAFNQMPERRLVVSGDGPDREKLEQLAGPNVEMKGHLSFGEYKDHLAKSKAFIHVALEDFGIVMVEALASGTPVIALDQGGSLDIVKDGENGLLIQGQSEAALIEGIKRFEQSTLLDPEQIAATAKGFDSKVFKEKFTQLVTQAGAGEFLG